MSGFRTTSDKFVIEGNLIHVLGKKSLAPVNFAA